MGLRMRNQHVSDIKEPHCQKEGGVEGGAVRKNNQKNKFWTLGQKLVILA